MDACMHTCVFVRMDEWMNRCMEKWVGRCMNGWIDEQMEQ